MFVSAYELGQIVFLKTDPEQEERIITQIKFGANNSVTYYLAFGAESETQHYDIEMSATKDLMKALNISDKECR